MTANLTKTLGTLRVKRLNDEAVIGHPNNVSQKTENSSSEPNKKKTVNMVQAGTQAPVVQEISKILNTDILKLNVKSLRHKVCGVLFG